MAIKDSSEVRNVTLSYPRSGKNWVAYIIAFLLDGETDCFEQPKTESVVTTTHMVHDIGALPANVPLVFVVRNYKECIKRHGESYPDGDCGQGNYWQNVLTYHAYSGPKMILYYEDLIVNPTKEIRRLADFFKVDTARSFLERLKSHRSKSIDQYQYESHTNGDASKLLYHSSEIDKATLEECDNELRGRNSKIYDLYLKRYQEIRKDVILISHRGNLSGPQPEAENELAAIQNALNLGYDVEVDVWLIDDVWYLGHDQPNRVVSPSFLMDPKLWLHCKNIEAFSFLSCCSQAHNYFWHDTDQYTLTSKCFIWTYPGTELPSKNGIAVMPEKNPGWNLTDAVGICSDFIEQYK